MSKFVKDSLRPALILVLGIGSYFVPKKKNYIVFLPGHNKKKFDGNLKWFFIFLQQKAPQISTAWLTDDPDVASELESSGMPIITYLFFPIWQILRAETIVIDTRQFSLAAGRFSVVQLWHGTGYKTVGANATKSWFRAMLSRRHYSKYKLLTATSPSDKKQKHANFGVPGTFITGSPRNDIFFGEIFDRQAYKEKLGLTDFRKIFLYAPTFRDHGEFEPLTDQMWSQLNERMKEQKSVFIVKKHPIDKKLKVPAGLENVIDITAATGDVQELLAAADTLITDYSSIVTDYALSGNPIIFYTFDIDLYLAKSRKLTDDFHTVVPGPFAQNEKELFALISDENWFEDESYQKKYTEFVRHYHSFQDGLSCQRVFEKII